MPHKFNIRFRLHEPQPNSGLVGHVQQLLGSVTFGRATVHISGIGSGNFVITSTVDGEAQAAQSEAPIELGISIFAGNQDEQDFLKAVVLVMAALHLTEVHFNNNIPVVERHQIWSVAGALGDIHPNIKKHLPAQKLPPTKKGNPKAFFERPENRVRS